MIEGILLLGMLGFVFLILLGAKRVSTYSTEKYLRFLELERDNTQPSNPSRDR